MAVLLPALSRLARQGVRIAINTRNPEEHDEYFRQQALTVVASLQAIDVLVLYTKRHHRKVAVIDRRITWEGSLNIMSHNNSFEVMRRINSQATAQQMV
jgi:phosphatidylserine/phosphatidylglycerophosphate/cardiolipin synthase-like enzyme